MENKYIHWILATLIGVFALVSACVNLILIFVFPFAFSDIDHTEAQRQSAEIMSAIWSIFAAISFCISILIVFACGKISQLVLKFFGVKTDEQNLSNMSPKSVL